MTHHVSLCADRAYAVPLSVTLASIALRGGSSEVSIIHEDIDSKLQKRIAGDCASVLSLEWIPLPTRSVADVHLPSFVSSSTAGRLLLPELLANRSRTIYLDCDVLCLDHLGELWSTVLPTGMVGAVRDSLAPFAAGPLGTTWWELGLPADSAYFNAGVLLMDLDALREADAGRRAVQLMRDHRLRWADQCALNLVLSECWDEIPRRWNVQTADLAGRSLAWALWPDSTAEAVDQPGILHFTERDKPWHRGSQHPAGSVWRDMQSLTAWPTWSREPRSAWQRLRHPRPAARVSAPRSPNLPDKEIYGARTR